MKKDKPLIFKLALVISDIAAVILSFGLAYYVRTHIDSRPYYFDYDIRNYIWLAVTLIPLWLLVNFFSGLYDRSIFLYRPKEYGRVFVASIVSIMSMISFEFFTGDDIFPVRVIAIYFVGINFIAMTIGRELIRFFNRVLLRGGVGRQDVLIIGNNNRSAEMAEFFDTHDDYGYNIVGIVARSEFLPKKTKSPRHFATFKEAVGKVNPEIIIHTDVARSEEIYNYAISHHLSYMFVPQQDRLLSQLNSVEIVAGLPVIEVKITKLFGAGRIWKRLMDIGIGTLGLIIASPIMLIIAIWMKLTAPKDSVFFRQIRLTRFNQEFQIYKFRSQKAAYDGLTPEEAFKKMGKPALAKKYRKNGDQLDD
ncbi:MAG: sugar transferase, partial [Candidatus Sacchiramonaceae bacterium]|nr:sugar transferase [Candidatus Saccharimonadaceae bacterium]